MAFFFLYQYGCLLQPHLTLEQNNPLQLPYEYYCRRQHTGSIHYILVTEDSKGTVAQIPLQNGERRRFLVQAAG